MLKTTLSKIRRVWSIAFLPRAPRTTRTTSGKFEKLSYAAVYKVQFRSKSDYRDQDEHQNTPKRVVEFAFTPKRTTKRHIDTFDNLQDPKPGIINRKKDLSKIISAQARMKGESECEKCERLIAKVFGIDKETQREEVQDDVNTLEEIRLQSACKDDMEISPVTDRAKRQSARTVETVSRPSKILENIAHINLANKGTEYSDRLINGEVSSVIYSGALESNRAMELTTVRATTCSENEEKVAQKVEKIDETPVVEARKPAVEGFNSVPKSLKNETLRFVDTPIGKDSLSPEKAEEARYDELASRCMNAPDDEIDERLLKEMDSLRASRPTQPGTPMYEEELVKTEMVKEERNMMEKANIGTEERADESKPSELNIFQRLYPTFDGLLSEKEIKQEKPDAVIFKHERIYSDERPLCLTEEATVNFQNTEMGTSEDIQSIDRPIIYPNQVLIDPYDKRTLAYETEDCDSGTYEHVPTKEEVIQHKIIKQEQNNEPLKQTFLEEKEVTEEEPRTEEFDPKYVVTCNETCPISADGLTTTTVNTETLKGAEAIYDDLAGSNLKTHCLNSVEVEGVEVEEVKVEEVKVEEVKVEEVKVEEDKVEKVKDEKVKVEEDKVEEANVEEDKIDEVKVEEVEVEEAEVEGAEAEKAKVEEVKFEEAKVDDLASVVKVNKEVITPREASKPKPILETAEAVIAAVGLKTAEISISKFQESIAQPKEKNQATKTEKYEKEHEGPNQSEAEEIEADPKEAMTATLSPQIETVPMKDDKPKECPLDEVRNLTSHCAPLPKLNDEQASLSELLRRVRERNRLHCKAVDIGSSTVESLGSQAAVVEPELGKCGKKPPACPPPAPKCPPPEPCKPPPCPPPPPPCPRPCKPACPPVQPPCPPKKSPCDKFKKCSFGVRNLISSLLRPQTYPSLPLPSTTCNINCGIGYVVTANALNNDAVLNLKSLGSVLLPFGQKNLTFDSCNFERTGQRERFVVKDFEPWTPIPSWPIPKKEVKRPLVCPKEGCKLLPPPKLNPPCQQNPCLNFPKRMFSLADFFILDLNESKLYNLEEI